MSLNLRLIAFSVLPAISGFNYDVIVNILPFPGIYIARTALQRKCTYNPCQTLSLQCLIRRDVVVNSKSVNIPALEERNALFSKDSDVRRFDLERVLCNICTKWLSVSPDDHLQAVQKWLQHRAACRGNGTGPLPENED